MKKGDGMFSDDCEKMIAVEREIKKVILGIDDVVEMVNMALFARAHTLLDGLPGVAKTALSLAIAKAVGGRMIRFQGRPDFKPGQFMNSVERNESGDAKLFDTMLLTHAGELTITLIDEITRLTPHAQAFWFDIMQEHRLVLARREILMPHNRILATKNKVTRGETWAIPQPELDRFMMNLEVGYPDEKAELRIIADESFDDVHVLINALQQVLDVDEMERIVDSIQPNVHISGHMVKYLYQVVQATRYPGTYGITLEGIQNIDALVDPEAGGAGISPRGAAKWRRIAKVAAFRRGSDHVSPDDALRVAPAVLAHRIFIDEKARIQGRNRGRIAKDLLEVILAKIDAPADAS